MKGVYSKHIGGRLTCITRFTNKTSLNGAKLARLRLATFTKPNVSSAGWIERTVVFKTQRWVLALYYALLPDTGKVLTQPSAREGVDRAFTYAVERALGDPSFFDALLAALDGGVAREFVAQQQVKGVI